MAGGVDSAGSSFKMLIIFDRLAGVGLIGSDEEAVGVELGR